MSASKRIVIGVAAVAATCAAIVLVGRYESSDSHLEDAAKRQDVASSPKATEVQHRASSKVSKPDIAPRQADAANTQILAAKELAGKSDEEIAAAHLQKVFARMDRTVARVPKSERSDWKREVSDRRDKLESEAP